MKKDTGLMKQTLSSATAAAALLLACATASFAEQKIATVDVTLDASAIENAEAAKFWSTLEGDLEEAIILRVADRTDESGFNIDIDLDEVALATSFQGALGVESFLAGDVRVTNSQEVTDFEFYHLRISALQDGRKYGDGELFSVVETDEYYQALVGKFAESVEMRLK